MTRHVAAVSISPESVSIVYMDDATDLRADALIQQTHTILMARLEPELQEELDDLETAVDRLLTAGIRRWATTSPVTEDQLDERLAALLDFDDDDDDDEESEGEDDEQHSAG